MSNLYLQVLADAAVDRASHDERAAVHTRAHFAAHPECAFKILGMDEAGYVRRGQTLINIEARCRPGWFTMPMWKQDADEGRPMEGARGEIAGYWYRVDDLRHPVADQSSGTPATQEMGGLMRKAMALHKVAIEVEAGERAERAQQRREKRAQRVQQRRHSLTMTLPAFEGTV